MPEGGQRTAIEHLWCILCTEALHLVWKLWCQRVVRNDGSDFTEDEVTYSSYMTLESQLSLDRCMAVLYATVKKALWPEDLAASDRPRLRPPAKMGY